MQQFGYFDDDQPAFVRQWMQDWHNLLVEYERRLDLDSTPYEYRERANTGILGAAAMSQGGLFWVEAQADRETDSGLGREDLSVIWQDGSLTKVEAKEKEYSVALDPVDMKEGIKKELKDACGDTETLKGDAALHIGIVYVILLLAPDEAPDYGAHQNRFQKVMADYGELCADFSAFHLCSQVQGKRRDRPAIGIVGRFVDVTL